tara:strand:+ start:1131 stop:2531 length:1401 start_codon:yes stop_codon:yes gene_type:complete
MTSKISFIKNTGLYFVGNSLSKIITFFLLPLYSKYLLPEDFGYYDLSLAYVMLAIPLITSEIYVGMMRFMKEKDVSEIRIKKILSSGSISLILFIAVLLIVWYLNYLFLHINYFELICFYALALVLQRYYTYITRALNQNTAFVISGIICTLFIAILNFIFILYFKLGIVSLFLAGIIGILIQLIFLEWTIKLRSKLSIRLIDFKLFKELIYFTLPLSIGSILFFFLIYYNKTVIENELGLSANGYYAIAGKFTVAIAFLTSAFTMAWQDMSFSMGQSSSEFEKLAKGIKYYMIFLIFGGSIIIYLVQFIFPFIIDNNYIDSYQIISLSILVTIIAALGDFISQTLLAIKESRIILYTSIGATLLNLIIIKYLVIRYGVNGVNISLTLVYSLSLIVRLIYLKNKFNFKLNFLLFPSLLVYILITCVVYATKNSSYSFIGLILSTIMLLFILRKEIIHSFNYIFQKK